MLPGSECGRNSICYRDQCVSMSDLDSSLFNIEYNTETLDLTTHCSLGSTPNELTSSNHDPHTEPVCINWENDFLCEQSQACPKNSDSSTLGLYIRHVCCGKCSSKPYLVVALFNRARRNQTCSILISFVFISFILIACSSTGR